MEYPEMTVERAIEGARKAAEVLAALSVTVEEAAKGFEKIAEILQQSEKGDTLTHVSTDHKGGQK